MAASGKYDYRTILRRWILIGVDSILILIALFIYLRFFHHYTISFATSFIENPLWIGLIIFLWFFYAAIFSLYKLSNVNKILHTVRNTVFTAFLTSITYLFVPFLGPTFPVHRLPAFVLIVCMVVLVLVWRLLYAVLFKHPILVKKAIVVGAGYTGRELIHTFSQNERIRHNTGYKIYGYIDDDPNKSGKQYDNLKVLGTGTVLYKYVRRLKIDEVILAIPSQESINSRLYASLIECENAGIQVTTATDIYEAQTGKVMVKKKGGEFYLTNAYSFIQKNSFYQVMTRLINILCALLACLFLIILLPFVFIANLISSRGPLFYSQERVGKNGHKFRILKFRTMIVDAEKSGGPQFATPGDDRITGIGKILRKTRLDELPQCLNILKGDMNLIGPRPEREIFIEELTKTIPFFRIRNIVKPGLTGWAQVNHSYASDSDDSLVKLQYDLYYIKHRSFLLDLRILANTISVMARFKGT